VSDLPKIEYTIKHEGEKGFSVYVDEVNCSPITRKFESLSEATRFCEFYFFGREMDILKNGQPSN